MILLQVSHAEINRDAASHRNLSKSRRQSDFKLRDDPQISRHRWTAIEGVRSGLRLRQRFSRHRDIPLITHLFIDERIELILRHTVASLRAFEYARAHASH